MDGIGVMVLAVVVIVVLLVALVGTALRKEVWAWFLVGLAVVSIIGVVVR